MKRYTRYDLLLRNAHVIDPSQDISRVLDVGIRDGRIAAIGEAVPGLAPAEQIGRAHV